MAEKEAVLHEMVDIQVGYQARGRVKEVPDGSFAMLGPADVVDGRIETGNMKRFEPEINTGRYLVRRGDVLVQARGQGHTAALVDSPLPNTVASNAFYLLRVKYTSRLLPGYLYWWLNQPRVQAVFRREQGQSTVSFLSKRTLSEAPLVVPSMDVQERIAVVLDLQKREQSLLAALSENKTRLIDAVLRGTVEEHGG